MDEITCQFHPRPVCQRRGRTAGGNPEGMARHYHTRWGRFDGLLAVPGRSPVREQGPGGQSQSARACRRPSHRLGSDQRPRGLAQNGVHARQFRRRAGGTGDSAKRATRLFSFTAPDTSGETPGAAPSPPTQRWYHSSRSTNPSPPPRQRTRLLWSHVAGARSGDADPDFFRTRVQSRASGAPVRAGLAFLGVTPQGATL